MEHIKKSIPELITTILSAGLFVGSFTFLNTCGPKDDGSFMTCHYAGNVIKALSLVILIQAVLALINFKNTRAGLNISNLLVSVVCLLVPGHLVATCMMNDMRCNLYTKPGVTVICIIIAAVTLISSVMNLIKKDS